MKRGKIGIFDSGFGGLTVMKAVKDLLPEEDIVYFGDTVNLPYGNKSAETVLRHSLENSKFLESLGIKLLIVACHSVCTTAYEALVKELRIPIIGMIEPSIDLLKKLTELDEIVLLGTKRTISSGVYQQMIQTAIPSCQINAFSCPLFVPLVEEGYANHPIAEVTVQEYLKPLLGKKVNAALLGCTHYPLLQHFIQKTLGPSTTLIDPSLACAEQAKNLLKKLNLLADKKEKPSYEFYVSDDPEKFRSIGGLFLNHPIDNVFCTQ